MYVPDKISLKNPTKYYFQVAAKTLVKQKMSP